jgi:predicted acetyltransferase
MFARREKLTAEPSYRRKGIATALLHQGLAELREHGVATARITCRDTNLASATVIERAGARRLENKHGIEGHLKRRYTIPTDGNSVRTTPVV